MSSRRWTEAAREEQSRRAQDLVAQGKFGGAGRNQGRKPKPRLLLSWHVACPRCGHEIEGGTGR